MGPSSLAHDLLGRDREEPPVGRTEGEHRTEVGVDHVELIDRTIREGLDRRAPDLLRGLVGRDLAHVRPGALHRLPLEPEVRLTLLPDHVHDRVETTRVHPGDQRLGAPEHVRVVGAGQPPVGGEHEDPRGTRFGPFLEQRVRHRPRLAGNVLHGLGEQLRVRARGLDALLGLRDPRRGDQLHRTGDLHRGLERADPPLDDAELRPHLGLPVLGSVFVVLGGHPVPPHVRLHLVARGSLAERGLRGLVGRRARCEQRGELLDGPRERLLHVVAERALGQRRDRIRVAVLDVRGELLHEPPGVLDREVVEVTRRRGPHVDDLVGRRHRGVLRLLEDLDDPGPARELLL